MAKVSCETKINFFEYLFKTCCVLGAIFLTSWCFYEYNLDEDLVQMEFKKFHSTEDRVYPALTLCFGRKTKYEKFSTEQSILKPEFFQIGSNRTTLKIEEYIETIQIKDFSSNKIIQYSKHGIHSTDQMTDRKLSINVVLRRYKATPCFVIGIPYIKTKRIQSLDVVIKKNIFEAGSLPTRHQVVSGKSQFSLGLTYQNQFFPLLNGKDKNLESQNIANTCLNFSFRIRGMEILKRRNKQDDPCNEYIDQDAEKVLDDAAVKLRCKPPYWDVPSSLPDCSKEQLDRSRNILDESLYESNAKLLIKPCRSILDLWYDYDLDDSEEWCTDDKDHWHISLVYNNVPFKEIGLVPAYTIWNLVSNIGVIIGFFFGFSLVQVPGFMLYVHRRLKGKVDRTRTIQNDVKLGITELQIRLDMIEKDYIQMENELMLLKHQ